MQDDYEKFQEAKETGRFEGQVLQSLTDIKISLADVKSKQVSHEMRLDEKASKAELESTNLALGVRIDGVEVKVDKNTNWRWYIAGGLVVLSVVLKFIQL